MAGKRKDNEIPACAGMTQKAGKAPRIIPNKHRRLQIAPTRRKLFGEKAKAEFLEWFAATCNCSLSARKAGFHYRTVIRHWREDVAFGERCQAALRMGYVRLEELALRAAEEAMSPRARRAPRGDRAPPQEHFRMDPTVALQLLREHGRALAGLPGGSGRGAKPGRRPRIATNAEVRAALGKRLTAYRARVRGQKPGEEAPSPDAPDPAAP